MIKALKKYRKHVKYSIGPQILIYTK